MGSMVTKNVSKAFVTATLTLVVTRVEENENTISFTNKQKEPHSDIVHLQLLSTFGICENTISSQHSSRLDLRTVTKWVSSRALATLYGLRTVTLTPVTGLLTSGSRH
jgi:hypothetical protein